MMKVDVTWKRMKSPAVSDAGGFVLFFLVFLVCARIKWFFVRLWPVTVQPPNIQYIKALSSFRIIYEGMNSFSTNIFMSSRLALLKCCNAADRILFLRTTKKFSTSSNRESIRSSASKTPNPHRLGYLISVYTSDRRYYFDTSHYRVSCLWIYRFEIGSQRRFLTPM